MTENVETQGTSAMQNIFAQADSVEQVIAQAVGYGSVCWRDTVINAEGDVQRTESVFDTAEADRAVTHAAQRLKQLLLEGKIKVSVDGAKTVEADEDVSARLAAQRKAHRRMSNLEKAKRFAREGDPGLAQSYATLAIAESLSSISTQLDIWYNGPRDEPRSGGR